MPYKIIQTLEKGKPVLTAVPHAWEKHGILYWPKNKAEKLLKIENTFPEDNWIPIPCELKRNYINNYENAQNEIRSMSYGSDSDVEQDDEQNKRQTAVASINSDITNKSMENPSTVDKAPHPTESNKNKKTQDIYILSDTTLTEEILENQKLIVGNQHMIMMKIADFSEKLDRLIAKNQSSIEFGNIENTSTFSVIDSLDALDQFENALKDTDHKREVHRKYSVVCKGKGKGPNCAYILIDILFSRKFLTKCSWAGGSRGEESKIPFKTYKNTIEFFYNLIHDCDQTFSLIDCHNFLKTILRNSTKRCESKGMRASTSKCRTKRNATQNIVFREKERDNEYDESQDIDTSDTSSALKSKKRRSEPPDSGSDTEKEHGEESS